MTVAGLIVAAIACVVSVFAYMRSGKAIRAAETANDLARKANEIASRQLRKDIDLNTPHLVFSVDHRRSGPGATTYETTVTILNSGSHPTQIIDGEIRLHFNERPEEDKLRKLAGLQVAPGSPETSRFEIPASLIDVPGTGIPSAEIVCKAIYSCPNQPDGRAEYAYVYEVDQHNFVPSHHSQ